MHIRFLGTGAAEGIPAINCDCPHCRRAREEGGKLVRERSSILFSLPGYALLVDTPPDIRQLINKNDITHLDGVFITRSSYEHIGGIKEFEFWRGEIDFLADERLFETIKREHLTDRLQAVMFHILYYAGAILHFGAFSIIPFAARSLTPIYGLSIKEGDTRVVYTSDTVSRLTNYARRLMSGCDLLIVNTPTFEPPKEDHITVVEAIQLKQDVGAKRLILTYINHHNKPHDELEDYARRFEGVEVAYDGMGVQV